MSLSCAELDDLEASILEQIPLRLTAALTKANRIGELEELIRLLGMEDLLNPASGYETYRKGKILVIGDSAVSNDKLAAIATSLKFDKSRFEFELDYEQIVRYNFSDLQYNANYRVVMFGPVPHSCVGKAESSSIITEMERADGYPRIIRLCGNQGLKITKTSFRSALEDLINQGYLAVA